MERDHRRLVIALASALAVALLAIAFLLGRISTRPAVVTVVAPTPIVASSEVAPPPINIEPAAPAPSSIGATLLPESPANVPSTTQRSAAPAFAAPPGTSPSPDRQQIAAYFTQVDRIEDLGAGDPQSFANSMVQSMSSGDFSGFDDLLMKARTQRQRLQSIAPPRACVEHHRLALTLSGDSVAMLERLKAAMVKGDTTALLTIASEGHTLETQANQLKAMGETIKRQAGF